MSVDPETTRIVRSWMYEGVTQLPDRVLDAVLDQLPTTPQRRVAGWPTRQTPRMNTMVTFGLAAAAVAVAVLIGINSIGPSNVGGPGPGGSTPTPEPTPTVTAVPTPTPSPSPRGRLPPGEHTLAYRADGSPRITVTLPADDWYGDAAGAIVTKDDDPGPPGGAGLIVFAGLGDVFVYGDPCQWASTMPDAPATTVDELVTALGAQASRDATAPVDVMVDGVRGQSMILHVPDDATFGDCDQAEFRTFVVGADAARYHQGPGQIDELWIVDVDGELVVIDAAYYEGTPQAVVDELRAIVESITFE
jgi:hypothetical protein